MKRKYENIKKYIYQNDCKFTSDYFLSNINCMIHYGKLIYSALILIVFLGSVPNKLYAQQLAEGSEKFLGAGTSYEIYREFGNYWNQLTPGNDGKWGSLTYARGNYRWTNLDFLYNFSVNRGIAFKHHTLVWGSQQPSWIAALDSASQREEVENWIKMVGERYPKMSMIDVVNEPFHSVPSYKKALGGDGTTGWDWVITSFELARKYCAPGVKLILNEYNVLHSVTVTNNYLNLINLLVARGLIDGIGVQGHYFEFRSDMGATSGSYVWDIPTIKNNLNKLTATGLPVYITEFDIDEPIDSNQLMQYKTYFPIFWSNPGVKGITLWGYIEDDVWTSHPNTYLIRANGSERPALTWLRNYIKSPLPPKVISPASASGIQRNPELIWNSSKTATSYRVQVSTFASFFTILHDTTVADTTLKMRILNPNSTYYWRVAGTNEYGTGDYSIQASFTTGENVVSVSSCSEIPKGFMLHQNYPNPFNPATTIRFSLPAKGYVKITLLNFLGQEIKTITEKNYNEGQHQVVLDANGLATGVYFYKMETSNFVSVKKLLLMK